MNSWIIRGKRVGRACWDPYLGFLVFSLQQERVRGLNTLPPAVKFEQPVCNVSVEGSPLETTLHSKVFTGASSS